MRHEPPHTDKRAEPETVVERESCPACGGRQYKIYKQYGTENFATYVWEIHDHDDAKQCVKVLVELIKQLEYRIELIQPELG